MPTLGQAKPNAKGPGQEIMDDISSAQQYVLDLQVLFYSLKTVAANAHKEASDKAANAVRASADAATGAKGKDVVDGPASTTVGSQRHIEDLTKQLEKERKERAKLQEQYDQAMVLLRKSYGQIVDDYLFATEQLHVRTKQLEGLMEAAATSAAAPVPDHQLTRSQAALSTNYHNTEVTIPQPRGRYDPEHQPYKRQQGHAQVEKEYQDLWDAISPTGSSPGPAGYGEGLIGNLVDTAAAALAAAAAGLNATAAPSTSAAAQPFLVTGHHGGHVSGQGTTAAGSAGNTATGGGPQMGPTSRSSSKSSSVAGAKGEDAGIATDQFATASVSEHLATLEQTVLVAQQRGKHVDGEGLAVPDGMRARQLLTPATQIARTTPQNPRAKAQARSPQETGAGHEERATPMQSSPEDDTLRRSRGVTPRDGLTEQRLPEVAVTTEFRLQTEEETRAEACRHGSLPHLEAGASFLACALRRVLAEDGNSEEPPRASVGMETVPLASGSGLDRPAVRAAAAPPGRVDHASASSAPGFLPSPFTAAGPESSACLVTEMDAAAVPAGNGARITSSFMPLYTSEELQSRESSKLQTGNSGTLLFRDTGRNHEDGWDNYHKCDVGREQEGSFRQRSGAGAAEAEFGPADAWVVAATTISKQPEFSSNKLSTGPRLLSEDVGLSSTIFNRVGDLPDESVPWCTPPPTASMGNRSAQAAARAAATELCSATAGLARRGRWDSAASDLELQWSHHDGTRNEEGSCEDPLVGGRGTPVTTTDASVSAGAHDIYETTTSTASNQPKGSKGRSRGSRRPDVDAAQPSGAPGSATKRLRRSTSSPAERTNRRAAKNAAAREVSAGAAGSPNAAAYTGTSSYTANRATSRLTSPADLVRTSSVARRATTAAAAELPQRRGTTGPPSRRRSLRNVQSVPTPGSSEHDSSPKPYAVHDSTCIAAEGCEAAAFVTPAWAAATATATAAERVAGETPNLCNWAANGGTRSGGTRRPSEASRASDHVAENLVATAGISAGATAAAAVAARMHSVPSEAEPGKAQPLDLNTYLLRMRARSAAAGFAVTTGAGGIQGTANMNGREAAGAFGTVPGSFRREAAGGAGVFNCEASQAAGLASMTPFQEEATATATATATAAPLLCDARSPIPGAAVAASTTAAYGVFGRSAAAAANAVAAAVAASNVATTTPVRAAHRINGDCCSATSSPSVEGLASLMRDLRQKLANMEEYDFGVEELSDDVTEGADEVAGDWRTDDEVDAGGGESGGDDDDESVLLGIDLGAGLVGSYAVYASGDDNTADDDDDNGGQDKDGVDKYNDVIYGTYDRLYSGTYGRDGIATARRVTNSATASAATAFMGTAHREDDNGAPRSLRGGGGQGPGTSSANGSGGFQQFPSTWFTGSASAVSSAGGTPRSSHDYEAVGGGISPKGMEGLGYGLGNSGGSSGAEAGFLERTRHPQSATVAAANGKAGSPGAGRRAGHETRGISSLLDSVNAATLGGTGSARGTTRGLSSTASAATGLAQGKVAAPQMAPSQPAPARAATISRPAPGVVGSVGSRSWSMNSQPDRVPPPDQTSPRKDSVPGCTQTASGKVSSKWNASHLGARMVAGAIRTGGRVEAGADGAGLPGAGGFAGSRWGNASSLEKGIADFSHASDAAEAAELAAGSSAAAPCPTGATPSPHMQSLKSEAMFAWITQRLDALQSSVSQGLGAVRGADDVSRASSRAGSNGSGGGSSGFDKVTEYRSAAAAAAAAAAASATWKGEASWRGSGGGGVQEPGDGGSGSGGASRVSQGSGLLTNHSDGGMKRGSFSSFAAASAVGAPGGNPMVGGGRPLRDGGSPSAGVGGLPLQSRGEHHSTGTVDWQASGDGANFSLKRKTVAAGPAHAGIVLGVLGTKPHGIVLHGEGDV